MVSKISNSPPFSLSIGVIWLVLTSSIYSQYSVDGKSISKSKTSFKMATTLMANISKRLGYPMEHHETVTLDGYKLSMYFMRQKQQKKGKTKTIFLSHGLFSSSDCWFLNSPAKVLPYKLYSMGYNVMLGNFRGTSHSLQHDTKPANSSEYWEFEWDVQGREDLPSMLDYTLKMTGQSKLILIGHSMGTTTAFVLLSEKPEYNEKLYKLIALAPAVFLFNSENSIKVNVASWLKTWGVETLLRQAVTSHGRFPVFLDRANEWRQSCSDAYQQEIHHKVENATHPIYLCSSLIHFLKSFFFKDDQDLIEKVLGVKLEGAAVKNLLHYAQSMNYEGFHRYDYGAIQNVVEYGAMSAPEYNLTQITAPTALLWSTGDTLSTSAKDVAALQENLQDGVVTEIENLGKSFGHGDYLFANSVDKILWPKIFKCLKSIKY